jgi:phage protein D
MESARNTKFAGRCFLVAKSRRFLPIEIFFHQTPTMSKKSKEEKSTSKVGATSPETPPSASPKKGEESAKKSPAKKTSPKKKAAKTAKKAAGSKTAAKTAAPAAPPAVRESKPKASRRPAAKPKATVEAPVEDSQIVVSKEDISLRAYFIAERRQKMGWPGDETSDWVEAERQLRAEALRKTGKKSVI